MDWETDVLAGVPLKRLDPDPDAAGVVVLLQDTCWPEERDWPWLREQLARIRLGAVVPQVRPWWIDRPDPAIPAQAGPISFIVETLVPWMSRRWPASPRFAVAGVGFGGQGALQLAYRFPQHFPIVAAVSPTIDFHRLHDSSPQLQEWFESDERARQETATLRLHPLNWPSHQWFAAHRGDWRFDGCERLASKLGSIGIPYTADLTTPESPDYERSQFQQALKFVAERLREPVTSREIRIGR